MLCWLNQFSKGRPFANQHELIKFDEHATRKNFKIFDTTFITLWNFKRNLIINDIASSGRASLLASFCHILCKWCSFVAKVFFHHSKRPFPLILFFPSPFARRFETVTLPYHVDAKTIPVQSRTVWIELPFCWIYGYISIDMNHFFFCHHPNPLTRSGSQNNFDYVRLRQSEAKWCKVKEAKQVIKATR